MPTSARDRVSAALRRSGPAIAALSAIALSQPLLDLFGRNPEFFVAQNMTTGAIIGFAAVIAFGPPLVLMAVVAVAAAFSVRAGRSARAVVLGLLAGAFALVLLGRDQESVIIAALLAGGVGAGVVVLEGRQDWLRTTLRYLSPLPVLVFALFVFASDTARLVWSPEAAAAPAEVVAAPAPVSLLVFDELPLASLLTADGTINAERFPNFARLAEAGTWYRNATSPLPRTEAAVPTILSGTIAPGGIPSTIDYPRNLFTMLADSHRINAEEEVTALCPTYACTTSEPDDPSLTRSAGALTDAAVVYGHRALPGPLREGLPPVNQSWGDFGEASGNALDPFAARRDDPAGTQTQVGKLAYFDRMIEAIDNSGARPTLNVAHGVFPHAPWTLTPEGNAYGSVTDGLDFDPRLVWEDDLDVVLHGQMQHLMQLGTDDAALGRLIDRLEATGQWDESLVAVVADHGAAFEPGGQNREPSEDNLDEIFRVPFIIKYPGQPEGVIDDEPTQVTDLVPTIADALDVETSWEFDGRSLLDADRPALSPSAGLRDGSTVDLDPTIEPLMALARRNHERFPHGDDWFAAVATGPAGMWVGGPTTALDTSSTGGWSWSTDRQAAFAEVGDGFVPVQFSGEVTGPAGAGQPAAILVAVNGTVAGVGTRITEDADQTWTFKTILAEEAFVTGANTVEVFITENDGDGSFVAATGSQPVPVTFSVDADGTLTTVRRGESDIRVVDGAMGRMAVEAAFTDGRAVLVDGWAADTSADRAPLDIALVVDGVRVSTAVEPYPALAEPEGNLATSGFRLSIPDSGVVGTNGVVVAVFEDMAVTVPVDWGP